MIDRFFTSDYVERSMLRDGRVAILRLLTPADKAGLRRGFERLSDESRYSRFLVPKQRLSDDELRYLTEIDQEDHFAIVALEQAKEGDAEAAGLGIARFIRLADPKAAEAAIALADEAQGQGLGRLLFLRLVAAARERGIERFRCEVLASNASMKALIDQITPDKTVEVGSGVMSIDLELPNVAPDATVIAPVPAYGLLRASAQNAIEWTAAVRRLWRK
ncbi:MAG: family N-acetyltransferase [Myxococcales bacterium]|nr:family N-acetyltransferase [Myxococcales bacterium]